MYLLVTGNDTPGNVEIGFIAPIGIADSLSKSTSVLVEYGKGFGILGKEIVPVAA
jgi:hypothetical protein